MTGSAIVTMNPLPLAFTVTGGGSYCAGGEGVVVGLSGSQMDVHYILHPSGMMVQGTGNPISFGLQTAGTYSVSALIPVTGCTNAMTGSAIVGINPLPVVVTHPQVTCAPNTVDLTASSVTSGSTPGLVFSYWTDVNATIPYLTPWAATAGTWYIKGTVPTTQCYVIQAVAVTVNAIPAANTGSNRSICLHASTQIGSAAIAGSTYLWTSLPSGFTSTTANPVVTPLVTTTYYLTETTTVTGCSNAHSVVVTVNPNPILLITNPAPVCSPNKVDLTAGYITANSTLNGATLGYWLDAGATMAMTNYTVAEAGTYYIKATTPAGCYDIKPVTVTVNPLPNIYSGSGSGSYCAGGPGLVVGISGSQVGVNYTLWYGCCTPVAVIAGTGNPISFGLQSSPGTYSVVAEHATTHCINWMYNCISILVNPTPVAFNVTGGGSFCAGQPGLSVGLSGSQTGVDYTLVPGGNVVHGTGNAISFGLYSAGSYTVTARNTSTNCNSNMNGSATIVINPTPALTITDPAAVCAPGTVDLTAPAVTAGSSLNGATLTYWLDVNASQPLFTPGTAGAGVYFIKAMTSAGCSDIKPVTVTVNQIPVAMITPGGPVVFCEGGFVNLTASGGSGYQWSNGSTSSMITVTAGGTYIVTVTSASGCTDDESLAVTVNPTSEAQIVPGGPTIFCTGGSVELTASGGTGYVWSNAATTSQVTVTSEGNYTVTVTNTFGCSDTETIGVTVNPRPQAVITPDGPTTFCQGGSVALVATGGAGYAWSNGSTMATIAVTVGGRYSVTVTNTDGCSDSESIDVAINPLPAAYQVTGGGTYCQNGSGVVVGLSGSQTGIGYTLMPGGIVISGSGLAISFGLQPPGTYTVTAINTETNCTNTMSGSAIVIITPAPLLVINNPAATCAPGTVNLTSPEITAGSTLYGSELTYWLNEGATIAMTTPAIAGAGIYYIKATTSAGCSDIKPVTVTVNPKPLLVTHPQSVCSPLTVDLTAPAVTAGSSLMGATLSYWRNAAATIPMTTPAAAGAGTYYIRATLATGCFDVKPVTVSVHPLPALFIGTGGGSYCAGGPGLVVGLSGSQAGVRYSLWASTTLLTPVPVPGTGGPISFGLQTTPGSLWVFAENTITGCTSRMDNCIIIVVIQPTASLSVSASANTVAAGTMVTFTALPMNGGANPAYQWKVNGFNAGTGLTFTYAPVNGDEVTCVLIPAESCPATSNSVVMNVTGVAPMITVTGIVDNGQTKCYSASQTLTVAGGNTTFVVKDGGSATMIAGQRILFLPGTSVKTGGYMHGYITTSNQYCGQQTPALPEVVSGDGEPVLIPGQTCFTIYPNPTTGNFTLEQRGGKSFDNVKVEIYGMHGERLMSGEMAGEKKHKFWTSGLPQGLYFVKVVADGYVETFKLVKAR
jgi:hypothetical protein